MSAVAIQYLEVVRAEHVREYVLRIEFSDGSVREVDFGPFLKNAKNPDTTDFRDMNRFKTFRVEHGDLVWGDFQMIFPIADLYSGEILHT